MELLYNASFGWLLITYVIACHGLCQILIYSPLFERIRECEILCKYELYKKFVQCPMCIGFWIGFITTILIFGVIESIACGFFISATCYFIDIFQRMIEKKGEM